MAKVILTENLRNKKSISGRSIFLDIVVTVFSIVSTMNGISAYMNEWFDPLGKAKPVIEFLGIGLSAVDVTGGILGFFTGLSIGLLFKALSEGLGLTVSNDRKKVIIFSLLMLGAADTFLMAKGQFSAAKSAYEYKFYALNAEKNAAKQAELASAKENVEILKAQIASAQKELLDKSSQQQAAAAMQSKAMLLKKEIAKINKKYDLKKKAYRKTDYKNQNWIETLREKEIAKMKKSIEILSPMEASMQYKEKLQKEIESLMKKKDAAVKKVSAVSEEIKRSIPVMPNANWVMFFALLSSLSLTLFSYKINELKGTAKADFETGLKALTTRANRVNSTPSSLDTGDEEEMSPLMKRLQEMKAKGETAFTDVVEGNEGESLDTNAIMLERIYEISKEIGEMDGGDLQKAALEDLKAKGLAISDYTHRKVIEYGVESGKLFQKVPRGAYYFKIAA